MVDVNDPSLATLCGAPRGQKDIAKFARGLSHSAFSDRVAESTFRLAFTPSLLVYSQLPTPGQWEAFMVPRLFVPAIIMLAVLCGSSFAKNAITTAQILATYTKEDCGIVTAILAREGTSEEVDAMVKEGRMLMISAQTKIVVDRVEVGGVLIHVKGAQQKLWIGSNALLHACRWAEEGDPKESD